MSKKPKQMQRTHQVVTDGITPDRAAMIGIPPGIYNHIEVTAMVVASREEILDLLIPFQMHVARLNEYMRNIDILASTYEGDALKAKIPREMGGVLTGRLGILVIYADQMGVDISVIRRDVAARFDGIVALYNANEGRGDDGASLRAILPPESPEASILKWRASQKKAGRPKASTEKPIDWLCNRLVEIFLTDQMTRSDAYRQLYTEVQGIQSDHPAAWEKLKLWEKDGDTDGIGLWRNVSNRPKLREVIENRKLI